MNTVHVHVIQEGIALTCSALFSLTAARKIDDSAHRTWTIIPFPTEYGYTSYDGFISIIIQLYKAY